MQLVDAAVLLVRCVSSSRAVWTGGSREREGPRGGRPSAAGRGGKESEGRSGSGREEVLVLHMYHDKLDRRKPSARNMNVVTKLWWQ